jgi:hypothetical protein
LYKLCDRIILDRINEVHYKTHLNHLAQKKWGSKLEDSALKALFTFTERHPFYMNGLCLRLWESNLKNAPTLEDVQIYWTKIMKEERQEIMRELSALSPGQRKVLIAIAEGFNKELTGKAFLNHINLTGSSVIEAIKILEQRDYIEKKENGKYHLIDPLIHMAINVYFE